MVLSLAENINLSNTQQNYLRILVDTGDLEKALAMLEVIKGGGSTPALDAMRNRGSHGVVLPPGLDFSGFKASGGPVMGGKSYLVGERGPELFTPGVSGGITPNGSFGGGANITVNVNGGDPNSIVRALQQYVRQSGPVPVNTRAM